MPGAVYTPLIARALPDPALAPKGLDLIMPERCAEVALKGMDLGLFYIPTQPHLAVDMGPRHEGVMAAVRAGIHSFARSRSSAAPRVYRSR